MKIDPDTLLSLAKSEHGEAYQVIKTGENHRLGVGITVEPSPSSFFIELLLSYCNNGAPDLDFLDKLTEILRNLKKQGYVIECEEPHGFNCTKHITKSELQQESEKISNILHSFPT